MTVIQGHHRWHEMARLSVTWPAGLIMLSRREVHAGYIAETLARDGYRVYHIQVVL